MATCKAGKPTKRIVNPGLGTGPMAYCNKCEGWRPAAQVPWGKEKRNAAGKITATYAMLAHETTSKGV